MPAQAVLLDTCAVIWLSNGSPLSEAAIQAIRLAGLDETVFASTVTAWGIELLSRPRRDGVAGPTFLPDPKTWFTTLLACSGSREAPLSAAIMIDACHLPGELHSDPAIA